MEYSLTTLDVEPIAVETPTGGIFRGVRGLSKLVGMSIMRSGECMEKSLRSIVRSCRMGKLLIKKQEEAAESTAASAEGCYDLQFCKLPTDLTDRHVLLLDPMVATGGTAMTAIQALIDRGAQESKITFLNLISFRGGIERLIERFPKVGAPPWHL